MIQIHFMRLRSLLVGITTLLVLCACQPSLNWREIHDTDGHFRIMMPGKPASASRDIVLSGIPCTMQMRGVTEEGLTFTVGWTEAHDAQQTGLLWQAMLQGMLSNIGATVPSGTAPGTIVRATGKTPQGTDIAMHARFLIQDNYVYQIVVTGPVKQLDTAVSDHFLQSFTRDLSKIPPAQP